jgi:large subunit ribosomal protein L6
MSRIGRQPIEIPAGVTVNIEGGIVTVKGPKGSLQQNIDSCIKIEQQDGKLVLTRKSEVKEVKSKHGLYRMLVSNMVDGVTKGFEKSLVISGVGFKAQKQGEKLVLNLGYSHNVEYTPPAGITVDCVSNNEIIVKGIDKEAVGQAAANIRAFRIPDPYHIYGVRYKDEVIQKKEGKTAGK